MKPHCDGCGSQINPKEAIEHVTTKSVLCLACQRRMELHSPGDWSRNGVRIAAAMQLDQR